MKEQLAERKCFPEAPPYGKSSPLLLQPSRVQASHTVQAASPRIQDASHRVHGCLISETEDTVDFGIIPIVLSSLIGFWLSRIA